MTEPSSLDNLLACPRCDAALSPLTDGYHCGGCKVDFPNLDGIPFLFAEPGYALNEWRARSNSSLQKLEHDAKNLDQELKNKTLHELTRRRLVLLRDAYRDQRKRLETLLQPLGSGATPASHPTYLAMRTRMPGDQGLNTYYANIHRDWAWGDEENRIACDRVSDMLGQSPGKVLVLGAGACRLASDLHRGTNPDLTVATDFNPLLLLLARDLLRGIETALYEFPIAPRRLEDQAVLRTLTAGPATQDLSLVLADANRPPFRPGSFDAVVTPWLIDILPTDFKRVAARINGLLTHGGQWINFGSLAFQHNSKSLCYSLEETLAVVKESGFEHIRSREDTIPYMCSPASRHGRQENVVTFGAKKTTDTPQPKRHTALPEWLVTGKEPVPLLDAFQVQAASTKIYAFIMGLIDGRRSIKDMAQRLEEERLMERDEAEASIRRFMLTMHEDSQH